MRSGNKIFLAEEGDRLRPRRAGIPVKLNCQIEYEDQGRRGVKRVHSSFSHACYR